MFDTAKLYYQINGDKDKRLTSTATFSFKNEIAAAGLPNSSLLASMFFNIKTDSAALQKNARLTALQRSLYDSKLTKTLDVVKVYSRQKTAKEKLNEQYTSGFFTGDDGYTFTIDDDPFANLR
ncbi:MAG: hypothetical protein WDM90_05095 [Ferruginibacter sp.]